jgi:hypothetical protein
VTKKKVAEILSVIFGPQIWFPALFFLIIFRSGLNANQIKILLPLLLLLVVVIPLGYLYIAPKVGWATNWDLPKRKERYPFLSITLVTSLISLWLIYTLGTKLLFNLSLLFLIMLLISMTVTYFWQISLHVTMNVFGSLITNFLFGWNLPLLYIVIPTIMWARFLLKRHTLLQLTLPILINTTIAVVGLHYFGYL